LIGTVAIARLNGADIDAFYARLSKKGLGPLSVRKCHAILSASLNQAVKWGWLDRNPIVRATPPGLRSREIIPPTAAEVRQLLDECDRTNPDLGALVYPAVTTGRRRGELCGGPPGLGSSSMKRRTSGLRTLQLRGLGGPIE